MCSRAHVLVDSARAALQEAAVISSRCMFLRTALQDQLTIAGQVNRMIHNTQKSFKTTFEKTLTDLDNADIRLNQTLELLRNSIVDPAFISPSQERVEQERKENRKVNEVSQGGGNDLRVRTEDQKLDSMGEGAGGIHDRGELCSNSIAARARTLHDFVEDEGIENLKSLLRHSIDYVQESHDSLLSSLTMFDESIQSLSNSLKSLRDPAPHSEPLHAPLHALEEHTEAMASLLSSLTNHYDRCSLALKSSESSEYTPLSLDCNLYLVLSRDASQVPDVVHELRERLDEMEHIFLQISRNMNELRSLEHDTITLFAAFEQFQVELAGCIDGLAVFEQKQADLKVDMESRLEELWRLGEFYDGFVGAYDAMIIEVGRRKGVAARMESVVKDAVMKLQALYDEDRQDREGFKEEYGQWLPVDIWPGLSDPPTTWIVERDLQGGRELPKLGKDVIEKAMRRMAATG